ncbi:MAG: hypothetical protein ACFB51_10605 [Anaerolineae bacterium]
MFYLMPATGEWQSTEILHTPDGRSLEALCMVHTFDDEAITQQVDPLPQSHPLYELTGTRRHRVQGSHLTGHDFVGNIKQITPWASRIQGLWPRAGLVTRGTLFSPEPACRVAVLDFYVGRDVGATSVGVAVPSHNGPPAFSGPSWPGVMAAAWQGTFRDGDGEIRHIERRYNGLKLDEFVDESRMFSLELETWAPDAVAGGTLTGLARVRGHALHLSGMQGPALFGEMVDVLAGEWLLGFRMWTRAQRTRWSEVYRLRPA